MSTLEDKILGEKLQYYCSSSEDEKEESGDEGGDDEMGGQAAAASAAPLPDIAQDMTHWQGNSANTGPKGKPYNHCYQKKFDMESSCRCY